jgi:DNA primase
MTLANTQLTPQFVQAVRDAVDIVDIAGEYTKLRKAGRRYSALCPLHKERSPSFSIEPTQGLFYCFGCGAGGDAIKLHMLLSGDDFAAAMESLARRYGIALPPPTVRRTAGGAEVRDLEAVLEGAQEFFVAELGRAGEPQAYLSRRQISTELKQRFGLGYAPADWRRLVQALHPRFSLKDLEAAGLVARPESGGDPYDRFRHRLMFPIKNGSGRLVGFGGRTLGDDKAKYLNTAETDRFHKGSLLYGLDSAKRAIRETGRAVLVEGYFDVIATVAAGIEGVVASMGTALTPEQSRLLARFADEVVVGYDGDEAGENASRRALAILLADSLGVRRARFGEGEDPDSLRQSKGPEAVKKAIDEAPDLVSLEIDRLVPADADRNPRLRAKAATSVAELLAPIRDAILRYGYGKVAADRLGVPVDLLWKRLAVDGRNLIEAAPATRPAIGPAAREARGSMSNSLEARALQLLLAPDADLASIGRGNLPQVDAFLDSDARNIYGVFRRLFDENDDRGGVSHGGQGGKPSIREVLSGLAEDGKSLDRVAQLLLQDADPGQPGELAAMLQELRDRYSQQRNKQLAKEIQDAQRRGDTARLEVLLEEKTRLSRAVQGL